MSNDKFTVTEVEDLDLDHKEIAKYVGKDPESMRQLKRKWESTATGMWIHYVRSYKYSKGEMDQRITRVNISLPKLYTHCTRDTFNAMNASDSFHHAGKVLIIDHVNHKVALNDNGTCTVEQFGSKTIAEAKFNQIKEIL